jgi:hypothetical protein
VRRGPAAVRSLVPHRLALTAVMLTAVLAATLLSGLVSFAAIVTSYAVRVTLASSPATSILVTSSAGSAAAAAQDSTRVAAVLHRALPGGPLNIAGSLGTDYLNIPAAVAGQHAQTHIISLPDPARRAALVAGTWPPRAARGDAGTALPVAVPAATAARLRLRPGSTLALQVAATGHPIAVRVTGIFRRSPGAGAFWALDPAGSALPRTVGGFTIYPSLVASQAGMTARGIAVSSASWAVGLDTGRIGTGNLTALATSLGPDLNRLGSSARLRNVVVTTGLPALLAGLEQAVVVARSQLAVGILILLVIAGATLALAVSLLSSQREAEAALLRARGASRRQLFRTGAAEALLLVAPAALLAPILGGLALPALARRGPLAHSASPYPAAPPHAIRIPVAFPAAAWLAALAAAAACALVIMRSWVNAAQSPVKAQALRGRRRAVAVAARSGLDLALVALAVLAGWQLAHYQAPVTVGVDGSIGVDPILVTAPVLGLAAAAVLMLRLLPAVARIGDRAAVRGRDLTAAVAAWQISRRPVRQAGPVLLAVLAVATSVIAIGEWSTWQRSVQDQASFATGADLRVNLPPAAPLPADRVTTLTGAHGVTGATPVIRSTIGLPNSGTAQLLALDARQATGVAAIRPDLAQGSPAALLRRLAPGTALAGAPLAGRPARLLITARLSGAVGKPYLSVTMADGYGISYQVQAGPLPADGRPHTLTVPVAPEPGMAYPLRITGFSLQYLMPRQHDGPAQLVVSALRGAPRTGPAGPPASLGPQGDRYKSFGSASPPGQFGLLSKQPVVTPAFIGHAGLTLDFTTGSGYGPPIHSCGQVPNRHPCGPPGSIPTIVAMTYAVPSAVVPAAVTSNFASATGTHLGQTFPVIFQGATVAVRVVGIVSGFPTLTGPSGGVIVDQGLLQQAVDATGTGPAGVTEWWLRGSGPVRLPALPQGTTVTSRAAMASALLANPLGAAPQLAMLAIAAAAVILAAGGFLVAAATARERAHDMALLASLGATRRQLTRLLCLEQALVAIPAAAAGLLLGLLLARLVIPAVTITGTGRHPQPPALIQVPVAVPVAVAVIIAVVPVLIAGASGGPRARVSAHTRAEAST